MQLPMIPLSEAPAALKVRDVTAMFFIHVETIPEKQGNNRWRLPQLEHLLQPVSRHKLIPASGRNAQAARVPSPPHRSDLTVCRANAIN
jgi:hypothetical protein